MENWGRTRDTGEAAAVVTLGGVVRPETVYDEPSGKRSVMWLLGPMLGTEHGLTGQLRKEWWGPAKGRRQVVQWAFNGLSSRRAAIKLVKRGGIARVMEGCLVYGEPFHEPGLAGYGSTSDLRLMAALACADIPLVGARGSGEGTTFLIDGSGADLVRQWRLDGVGPEETPFGTAMAVQMNYGMLLEVLAGCVDKVRMVGPSRSVSVSEDASDAIWERATNFLIGK